MKLRPIRHILIIILMIVATHQASAQDTVKASFIDFVKFPNPFSHGVIVQSGEMILYQSFGKAVYFIKDIDTDPYGLNTLDFKVHAFAFSPDSNLGKLALGCSNGTILVKDFDEAPKPSALRSAVKMQGHNSNDVTTVAFSPDGQTLASGATDGTIIVWDTTTGKKLLPLFANKSAVNSVVFSPNGELLISGADDGSVKLWNLHNQSEAQSLINHEKGVQSLAFSPDNNTIASGGKDGKVKLWRVSNKTDEIKLSHLMSSEVEHRGGVNTIAFSPDGIHLATGGILGTIFLWNIQDITNIKKIDIKARFKSVYDEIKNMGKSNINFTDIYKKTHEETLLSIVFSENGRDLLSISKDKFNEWELGGIDINPETSELIFAEKPEPLIEKLREQDEKAPIVDVDNVVHEVDSETAETIVSGRVTDLNEIRSFTVNGKDVKISENGKFKTSVKLEPGENKIPIVAIDHNGNKNDEKILYINRKPLPDITSPTVEVINKEFNEVNVAYVEYNEDVFEVQVKATDENSGVKEVRVNEQTAERVNGQPADANVSQLFTAQVPLQDSEQKIIVVEADDNSGNTSEELTLTVRRKPKPDTELPVITIEGIADGEQQDVEPSKETFLVKGKATDVSGISTVKVKVNNKDVHDFKETEIKNGEFNTTVSLQDGNNQITIIAIDNHGNEGEKQFAVNRLPQIPVEQPIDIDGVKSAPIKKQTDRDYKIQILSPIKEEDNIIKTADNPIFVLFKVSPSNNIDVNVHIRYADLNRDFPCIVEHQGGELFRATITLATDQSTMKINVESEGQTVATEQYTIIHQNTTPNTQTNESKPLPVDPIPTDRPKPIKIVSLRIQNVKLHKSKSNSKGIRETEPDGETEPPEIEVVFSDSENIPKIAVTTSSISGEINIFGKTEGPVGGTIKYSLNNDSRIKVEEYGTEKHEFQLTEEQKSQTGKQNQQVVLGYGDNTLTFYAVPREEKQADDKRELIINRVHEREGKDHALLIAVNDYSDSDGEWNSLEAPIRDAKVLKEILENEYKFQIYPDGKVIENPTRKEIRTHIRNLAKDRHSFKDPDYQLIIFLAGHGYVSKAGDVNHGYFLPKPVKETGLPFPNLSKDGENFDDRELKLEDLSVTHRFLRETIDGIKCNNILVIMDTCFSGAFDKKIVLSKNRGGKERLLDDKIREKLTKKTRQYLTSGALTTVLDTQKGEEHSPFALRLFDALREKGDGNEDSIVTFNELEGVFFEKLPGGQEPRAGTFGDKHVEGSEFLFWKR